MTVGTEVLTARPTCQAARASLSAYVRAGLSPRAAHRVSGHLECCRDCTALYLALVEGEDDAPAAGRLLTGVAAAAVAAVLGGLVMAGLGPFGGPEDSSPEPGPVGAPPAATAPRSGTDVGVGKPRRKPRPTAAPTPDSPHTPVPPASSSGFAPPGPHATQASHPHAGDVASSLGHGDNGGGQLSPTPPPAVVSISSGDLAPGLPVPSITITVPLHRGP